MTLAALSWPEASVYIAVIAAVGLVVAVLVWSIFRTGQTAIRSDSRQRDPSTNPEGLASGDRQRRQAVGAAHQHERGAEMNTNNESIEPEVKGNALARLARVIMRHRRIVAGGWIVLTIFGAFSAQQVSKRWLEQFSIPGFSAYEANQRTLHTFGSGEQAPNIAVLRVKGDVTKSTAVRDALSRVSQGFPRFRTSSYFTTGSLAYVSADRHTAFATFYPPGRPSFSSDAHFTDIRAALERAAPAGVETHVTGRDALYDSQGSESGGPSVLTEALIGGAGALVILLFVFGTLPAILVPIMIAVASILNTFTLIWALTYITDVSIIVQFLVALVGLGVAIDYALPMIFRSARNYDTAATWRRPWSRR